MPVSSHAVANEFLRFAEEEGKQLTNMQVQKLVFIANGFSLAIFDRPLYFHNNHAWQWGPVIPKLYKALQKYGSDFVTERLTTDDAVTDADELGLIKAVWNAYGHYTGSSLSAITHRENTPWSITWNKEKFSVINNDLIASYYKKLIETA